MSARIVAERNLLWKEGGQIYVIRAGTPKKVSLGALRSTAAGLDPLGRSYIGVFTPRTTRASTPCW